MGDVFKKMIEQVPERFLRSNILLATDMAKPALELGIAVQTVPFFPFFKMTQAEIFL